MGWGGVRKKHICFGSGWEWVGFLSISRVRSEVADLQMREAAHHGEEHRGEGKGGQ